MKTIHGYKNTSSFVHLVFLLIVLCLAMTACKWDNDFCKLTDNDKEFLLENTDYLEYLENGNTKIKVKVETKYNNSWNKGGSWFYTGDGGYESGTSAFYLPDSSKWITIISSGCFANANVFISPSHSEAATLCFKIPKDSVTNRSIAIQNVIYENCIVFSDTIDIKELVFVKGDGIVKIELNNGTKFELLTKN